ncbi:MAG: hypothetical protein IPI64_08620 [Chloracidobacterium sp.]|nr:hypothetical protein [Chloracidobacterium sp.]
MRQIFIFCLLLSAACLLISCGGPAERIKETAAITPTPSPTPAERDISGNFLITGSAANEMDPYTGSLSVVPKGDNYEFRWATTKGTRVGTGVQLGSTAAVSFAATGAGKGCGVVLYKIASDGSLDGRNVMWGEEKFGTENAVRVEGTGFVGKYMGTGTMADGKTYLGSLAIVKDGAGYDFSWLTDKPQVGFGIWKGSYAAVSFGGRQCSFALYDIQSNGSLEGNWGGQKQVTFGTETAKRQ